jgi:uncharacterized protein
MAGLTHSVGRANGRAAVFASARVLVIAYGAAAVAAEAIVAFVDVTTGILCDAGLLFALLTHYVVANQSPSDEGWARAGTDSALEALPVLAFIPLIRITSVTTPIEDASEIYWYALVGAPLLVAAILAQRLLGLSLVATLRARSWGPQLLIAFSGLPLGLAAYGLLQPDPIVHHLGLGNLVLGSVILLVFSGLTEELIFRGLLQRAFMDVLGRGGIVWSSALFASTYLGARSAAFVVFIGITGLGFGLCLKRTGSIAGIAAAHGLLSIGLILVWPAVLG